MAAGYIVFFGGDGTPATNAVYCNSETDGTMNFFELLGETGVGGIQKAILIDGVEKFVRIFIRRVYPYRCDKIKSDYVKQLMDYGKKFLIIGDKNCITYKEIFPYIKENKLWVGVKPMSGSMWFPSPSGYESKHDKFFNGVRMTPIACCWFTNIPNERRNRPLDLYCKYDPNKYPKYDNYDAIEVSKTIEIPEDYDGVMGVPISFLDKYCPTQFEIVDINPHFYSIVSKGLPKPKQLTLHCVGKKDPYARILIRKLA